MDILLTDADNPVGEVLLGRFLQMGLDVAVAVDFTHPATELGARRFPVPPCRDNGNFLKAVRALYEKLRPRWILPVFWPEVLAGSGMPVLCDSRDKLLLLDNKLKCCNLAKELGIPQPRRYASPDEVTGYPVVFKRTDGHSGQSVYFPKERRALENLCASALEGTYIITEDIEDGVEISVDALRWGPDFFCTASYEVLEPKGRKGISTKRIGRSEPLLESYARRILDAADYHGVAGFDFIVKDSRPYFLECNPRFSGGLPSAIAGGVDLPKILLELAEGGHPGVPVFRPGIITSRQLP